MIIPCFRCGKKINIPDAYNADYIIASDTVAREPREVLVALKHNQTTLQKAANIVKEWRLLELETIPDLPLDAKPTEDFVRNKFQDNEYDAIEVPSSNEAIRVFGKDLVKVVVEIRERDIQKTGIICPECYKNTDFVIWGIHKGQGVEKLEKK